MTLWKRNCKSGLPDKFLMKFPNAEFKQEVLERTTRLLSFDMIRERIENVKSNNSSIVAG
jgi:hypothetical protein